MSRVKVALIALVLVVAGLGVFTFTRDSACDQWQDGYRVVFIEHVKRFGPFIPGNVLEDVVARYGPQPAKCEVPLGEHGVLLE